MSGKRAPAVGGRLRAVAAFVPPGARVADIGSHHGRLPLHLLASGRASRCFATEVGTARITDPLRRLHERGAPRGLELRFGDGFRALGPRDRFDVATLAGLGAESVIRILEGTPARLRPLRRLVVQPQTDAPRVRDWLRRSGFGLVGERVVVERGRFYFVLAAEPGAAPLAPPPGLDEADLVEAGPWLVRSGDPLVRRYWERESRRLGRILGRATLGPARDDAARRMAIAGRVLAALGGAVEAV